ncbi:MAG: twin transmembrane helix small protein [Kangiellaceae bacterium]|nr:twin transmembrane helix small protein [Kangiellaceae bacterium]
MIVKILIIAAMLAILFSLFRALYFLVTEQQDSRKTAKSLSWRIGLSIALFILIVTGILMGWIEPHGLPTVIQR